LSGTQNGGALHEFGVPRLGQAPPRAAFDSTADSAWYAVQTRPRHEKRVNAELQGRSIDTFLPLLDERHTWSDRQKIVQVPLFPGYVFTRIRNEACYRIPILRTSGVLGFVGVRGVGTPIPEEQIQAIQSVLAARVPYSGHPFLSVGKKVRIVGGSLDGIQGIITSKNRDASLVISIELIQRSIAIRVVGYDVEPA
jgi:transcription antitermination factor NusG